jgi:hypothetical protein
VIILDEDEVLEDICFEIIGDHSYEEDNCIAEQLYAQMLELT